MDKNNDKKGLVMVYTGDGKENDCGCRASLPGGRARFPGLHDSFHERAGLWRIYCRPLSAKPHRGAGRS